MKDLLECVEEQLHNLSLPARKRDKLRKWASAVKKQVHELKLKKSTASTQDATRADTKPPTSVRPMEHLKVQIASPEEEPDPLAAELAARRQELLGDFWFFLKYRFELQFEPSNDFLQLAGK